MRTIVLAVAAGAVLLAGQPAQAAPRPHHFYVSPHGSDRGSGTSAHHPFRTVERAQQAARRVHGARVSLAPGTYHLSRPLVFGSKDSGTTYEGPGAVLSGGRALRPHWRAYKDGIQVAEVGRGLNTDGLFVNGRRQVLARYPNADPKAKILDGSTTMADLQARSKRWANPTTGDVRALHCGDWGGASFQITGPNLALRWVGDNNRASACSNPSLPYDPNHAMVEGVLEELDAPGEWFYDKGAGRLYYDPPAGTDLAKATVETAEQDELVHVDGARDLTFSGLTFTGTHRTLFDHPYEGLQLGDWSVARDGAVYLKNATRVVVTRSVFDSVGGNGVFMDGYNDGNVVSGSTFRDSGASDVQIVGSPSAVRDRSTWDNKVTTLTDTTPGPKGNDYPRSIVVSGNSMTRMGRFEKQSAGVNVSMSRDVTVRGNTIHDSPRSCVNINDGTWGGHLIEGNDLFDCVTETSDHGPFNSWGRDRFWPLSADDATQKKYAKLDVLEPNVIRGNRIWHSSEWAIDLDDGSGNYRIENNLLLNSGIKLRDGFSRTVLNNILVNGSLYEQVSHADDGDVIKHNIVLASRPFQNVQSDPATAKYLSDENLFYNNGKPVTLPDGWPLDKNSKTADPLFAHGSPWDDPALKDFTVAAGSPALALGFKNFPMKFGTGRPGEATPPPVTWASEPPPAPTLESQPEPLMGATATAIYSDAVKSSVGLGDRNGLYLPTVPADSYAAGQGLATADVIRSVNGTDITTRESFWKIYNALAPGAKATASLWRSQAAKTITFTKPATAQTYNDTAGVDYTGNGWSWHYGAIGGANSTSDDLWATTTHGDAFTYAFNGTGVDYIAETNSDEGTVDIYVDGELKKTVDCATPDRRYQQTVYSITGLSPGPHTIKGVMTGGSYMIVDAFQVHP